MPGAIATRRAIWPTALALFIVALAIYGASAALLGRLASPPSAYFDQLADALLHGRLYLAQPAQFDDLTPYGGHWYVPFPPLPALLLLPWAALGGLASINTVLFGATIGGLNVALAFLLLDALAQRGWTQLGRRDNLWLTLVLGLGCVHWYMATLGSVWFLAQICTLTFLLLALWCAVATRSALLAGASLGLAMLGRPHVALCYPLLLGIELQHRRAPAGTAHRWRPWLVYSLAPLLLAGLALLGYNAARFGNPLDFGYLRQNVARELAPDLRAYGQFSLRYMPRNLWAMLLAHPVWSARFQQFLPTIDGMSLLLTTPALLTLARARRPAPLVWGAWLAIGLILIPLLGYYNTGWWQFGYRFSLDFMPAALVLLALAAGPRVGWPLRLLILAGVAVNAWGAWWFLNPRYFPPGF